MLTLCGGTRPSGETCYVLPPLPTSQHVMTVRPTRMHSKMLQILYPNLCHKLLHTNMSLWGSMVSHTEDPVDRFEISRQYKEHLESVSLDRQLEMHFQEPYSVQVLLVSQHVLRSQNYMILPQDVNPLSDEEALLFCNTETSLHKRKHGLRNISCKCFDLRSLRC